MYSLTLNSGPLVFSLEAEVFLGGALGARNSMNKNMISYHMFRVLELCLPNIGGGPRNILGGE